MTGPPQVIREDACGRPETTGVACYMSTQTLLLLTITAVIVGYAAYKSPTLGTAMGVAAAVVGILYLIIQNDQNGDHRP